MERRRQLIRERLLQLSYHGNLLVVRIVKLEFPALPIRSDKVSVLLSIIVNKHSNSCMKLFVTCDVSSMAY